MYLGLGDDVSETAHPPGTYIPLEADGLPSEYGIAPTTVWLALTAFF
jgi:hypothetical protein